MTKREKITLIIALALLAAVLFLADNSSYNKKLIKDSNAIIKELHKSNKVYTSKIATLQDSIDRLQKKDTVIITRYKQKIDSIYVYKHDDYISFYDTLLHTNLLKSDTFICFDSINIQKLTTKIVKCERDSELLANCYLQNNIYSNIIAVQDSVIILKNSEIEILDSINKEKIKKLRKQRNTFAGATFVEFLVILGLILK